MRTSIASQNKASSNRNSILKDKPSLCNPTYVELEDVAIKGKVVIHQNDEDDEVFEGNRT